MSESDSICNKVIVLFSNSFSLFSVILYYISYSTLNVNDLKSSIKFLKHIIFYCYEYLYPINHYTSLHRHFAELISCILTIA